MNLRMKYASVLPVSSLMSVTSSPEISIFRSLMGMEEQMMYEYKIIMLLATPQV